MMSDFIILLLKIIWCCRYSCFLAALSIPLELILIFKIKKNNPDVENEIEKIIYGKGVLGKYKAMMEVMRNDPPEKWFAIGVIIERWLRILPSLGFAFVIVMMYLPVSK